MASSKKQTPLTPAQIIANLQAKRGMSVVPSKLPSKRNFMGSTNRFARGKTIR